MRDQIDSKVIASIGAVFDFYAGTVKRSSPFWIKLGLEWLPRLFAEPKRLWKRNFISTPLYLLYLIILLEPRNTFSLFWSWQRCVISKGVSVHDCIPGCTYFVRNLISLGNNTEKETLNSSINFFVWIWRRFTT